MFPIVDISFADLTGFGDTQTMKLLFPSLVYATLYLSDLCNMCGCRNMQIKIRGCLYILIFVLTADYIVLTFMHLIEMGFKLIVAQFELVRTSFYYKILRGYILY